MQFFKQTNVMQSDKERPNIPFPTDVNVTN